MASDDKILSVGDKVRLLARDIYGAAHVADSLVLNGYVPSKQIQSLINEDEYRKLIRYMAVNGALKQAWLEIPTGAKRWDAPKESFRPYKLILNQPEIRRLLGLNDGANETFERDATLSREPNVTATPSSETDIKYRLTYNPSDRELRLNGVYLAKPQFGSENDLFLRFFVGQNNTGEHKVDELLTFMKKSKLTKRPTQILGDIRITGDLKRIFFPNASTRSIEFCNPITFTDVEKRSLPEIDPDSLVKDSQK